MVARGWPIALCVKGGAALRMRGNARPETNKMVPAYNHLSMLMLLFIFEAIKHHIMSKTISDITPHFPVRA